VTVPEFLEQYLPAILMLITGYFALSTLAMWIQAILSRNEVERLNSLAPAIQKSSHFPEITILVPACNEESVIESSVRALLRLDYPNLKIIVINDGSKDGTLGQLTDVFQLKVTSVSARTRISPLLPRSFFKSSIDPRLMVLEKRNSGKADSINCALQFVESEFFAISDADTEWELSGLRHMVAGISAVQGTVIAVGGVVGVSNSEVCLLTKLQMSEYQRAFFVGRLCWNSVNAVPMISGAAGLYRTDVAVKIGGIPVGTLTEDLEFTLRLHAFGKKHIEDYRMLFVQRTVCYTHAPELWSVLIEQRARWQRGLVQCMTYSPKLLTWSTPWIWMFEVFSAPMEWIAFILVLLGSVLGLVSPSDIGMIVLVSLGIGFVNAALAVWVARPIREYQASRLFFRGVLELFGYRQILSWVRFRSMWTAFKVRHPSWRAPLVDSDAKGRKHR
jgi:cellulose synthase/poly-beta-1,6-N-acetylglucosamine synthase-like glycosyltransferase